MTVPKCKPCTATGARHTRCNYGLTEIASRWIAVAIAWHAVLLIALVAVGAGWRPTHRTASLLVTLLPASVAIASVAHGNPFNGIVFAAITIVVPCPTPSVAIGLALLAGGGGRRAWRLTLAGAGVFYAGFGAARLGVLLDLGLLVGAVMLAATASSAQVLRAAGSRPPVRARFARTLGAARGSR